MVTMSIDLQRRLYHEHHVAMCACALLTPLFPPQGARGSVHPQLTAIAVSMELDYARIWATLHRQQGSKLTQHKLEEDYRALAAVDRAQWSSQVNAYRQAMQSADDLGGDAGRGSVFPNAAWKNELTGDAFRKFEDRW